MTIFRNHIKLSAIRQDVGGIMKTFLVLQQIVLFRVNWRTLYNPEDYQLVLIVADETLSALADDQKQYFHDIRSLKELNIETISPIINALKQQNTDLYLVTNDETCIALAATLRKAFDLPGDRYDTVKPFLDKLTMKQRIAAQKINLPKYIPFTPEQYRGDPESYLSTVEQQLGYPIFAKPIDSAASLHTAKLKTPHEFFSWAEKHSDFDNYELDEFITGKLFHCESLIRDNKILFAEPGEFLYPCYDFMSGKVLSSFSISDNTLKEKILAFNASVINALRPIPNCATHFEFFQRPSGEFVFLEIACRAPGAMIVEFHEKRCGINIEQAHFSLQMGISPDLTLKKPLLPCAWAWFPKTEGTLRGWRPLAIQSPHQFHWYVKPGDYCHAATSLIDRAGGVLLWNEDDSTLRQDCDYLAQLQESVLIME